MDEIPFKFDEDFCLYSGGLQGQVVFEQLRIQIGEENVYDLVKDKGPQRGLKENQRERNLRIIGLYSLSRISLFFSHFVFDISMWWRWNSGLGFISP
jgi:hypothetical protein